MTAKKTPRSRPVSAESQSGIPDTNSKRKAALNNYEQLRQFYQDQTIRYSRWYIWLQVITLVGTAVTPVVLLVDEPWRGLKLIQALPAAIAGLAAAINAAFRFRQDWAQNYATLSALMNEYQLFTVRALPDYNKGEDEAIYNFQNRISNIVMQEVKSWQIATMSNEGEQKRQEHRE